MKLEIIKQNEKIEQNKVEKVEIKPAVVGSINYYETLMKDSTIVSIYYCFKLF